MHAKTPISLLLSFLSLSLTTTPNPTVSCFTPFTNALHPTTYASCFQIIKFLVSHERITLPTTFSRRPHVGYKLPEQWYHGTCILQLDMNDEHADEEETTTFKEIMGVAATVMIGCVVPAPHFGGTMFVGEKGVMNVTIFGMRGRARRPLLGPGIGVG